MAELAQALWPRRVQPTGQRRSGGGHTSEVSPARYSHSALSSWSHARLTDCVRARSVRCSTVGPYARARSQPVRGVFVAPRACACAPLRAPRRSQQPRGASRLRRWCVRRAARSSRSRAPRAARLSARPAAQTTPLVAGLTVAAAALTARSAIQYYQVWKVTPRLRKFYEGGFEATMDKREAALILGLRCVRRWRSSASPRVPARAA